MAPSSSERNTARSLIKASKASTYDRVFFLGPYARWVSFASQQNRALNLLWALQLNGVIAPNPDKPVAVVGAGLSGVTCSAALADLGYSVVLYEAGRNVLNRQLSARHRYIHPTINRWPFQKVMSTTQVPYFDWVSEICSDLLRELRNEWGGFRNKVKFESLARVVDFHESRNGEVAVETLKKTPSDENRYAAVLVTSGFEDEALRNRSDLKTYWDPDSLDAEIERNDVERFLVSGCGDGGLIDALRFSHKNFDDGRMIVTIAELLDKSDWAGAEEIKRAESALADSKHLSRALRLGSRDLEEVYSRLAETLPKHIEDQLNDSLRLNQRGFVTILSREKYPYSPMAAPIHKLLVAHAMKKLVVTHVSCEVQKYSRNRITCLKRGRLARPETLTGRVVVRHGANPNFMKFFQDNKKAGEELILRQKLLAENLDDPIWSEGDHRLRQWPPPGAMRAELRTRYEQGAKLIQRLVGLSGYFDMDDNEGFVFFYSPEHEAQLEKLPPSLFGFPLVRQPYGPARSGGAPNGGPAGSHAKGVGLLGPGAPIVSALDGRLGPIVKDTRGSLFALTASHVLQSTDAGDLRVHVFGPDRGAIGEVAGPSRGRGAGSPSPEIGLLRLHPSAQLSLGYGHHKRISDLVDARKAFGEDVFLFRPGGNTSTGYVSASRLPIYFRLPDTQARIAVPDAVRIRADGDQTFFSQPGDSGAPVVDRKGALVGIVMSSDGEFSYVAPVAKFLDAARLELADQQDIGSRTSSASRDFGVLPECLSQLANARRRAFAEDPLSFGDMPQELADE